MDMPEYMYSDLHTPCRPASGLTPLYPSYRFRISVPAYPTDPPSVPLNPSNPSLTLHSPPLAATLNVGATLRIVMVSRDQKKCGL